MGTSCGNGRSFLTMKLLLVLAAIIVPSLAARLPYIVGGQDVDEPGKWPWQASIQMYNSHICGAAIISETWLVTAAHCVESPASQLSVVVGMHDRTTQRQGAPQRHRIAKIIQHPGWSMDSQNGFPNDIALMQLSTPADLSGKYAQTVHLADAGTNFEGNSDCWITGWGKLSFLQGPPNILQEANIDIYSQATCRQSYGDVIKGNHICVGKKHTSGSCSGDSGGPLVCKEGDSYTLAGVTSFGLVTCSTSYPSVYSRISYFRDWIAENSGV